VLYKKEKDKNIYSFIRIEFKFMGIYKKGIKQAQGSDTRFSQWRREII